MPFYIAKREDAKSFGFSIHNDPHSKKIGISINFWFIGFYKWF